MRRIVPQAGGGATKRQERNDNMRIGTLRRIVGALGGVLKMQVEIDGRDYPLGFSAAHAAMAGA